MPRHIPWRHELWSENGLFDAVTEELERAIAKHGFDRTPLDPGRETAADLVVLVEEVGEVARAMTYDNGNTQAYQDELVQVAAMALAMVIGSIHRT